MKKVISAILFAALSLLVAFPAALAYSVPDNTIVYVTPEGARYHRKSCTYIHSNYSTMTIKEAENRGYKACSRCTPDKSTGEYTSEWDGRSSSGASAESEKASQSTRSAPPGTYTPPQQEESKTKKHLILFAAVAFPLVAYTAVYLARLAKQQREAKERERIEYERKRSELLEIYSGKTLDELAPIPEGVALDAADGLPVSGGRGRWGSVYTLYVSRSGKRYHSRDKCGGHYLRETHALFVAGLSPCALCAPKKPDLSWYNKRTKIKEECQKYNITLNP